jgi:hypothetical protein
MEYKGNYWLTNFQMVKYQSILSENSHIGWRLLKTLNPATLLRVDSGPPEHDSLKVMDEVFSSRCLYLFRMGGSLPHMDLEGPGDGQMPAKGYHPLV